MGSELAHEGNDDWIVVHPRRMGFAREGCPTRRDDDDGVIIEGG